MFSARPHSRQVEVTAHLHTVAEVPLVDLTAGEVLLADFMEVEAAADRAEVEVGEVTARPGSLFKINYPDQVRTKLRCSQSQFLKMIFNLS